MLLCAERVFGFGLANPEKQCLPALLAKSREYQANVSTELAKQVLDALYELVRGFQAADEKTKGELLRAVLAEHPDDVYRGLFTVLLRLVFLLYAEDRGLLPSSLYVRGYSVHGLFERLRADAEQYPDTLDHRYGAWPQLLALFRLVHGGSHSACACRRAAVTSSTRNVSRSWKGRVAASSLAQRGGSRKGRSPSRLRRHLFRVLRNLLVLGGERLSYRTLDVEQIGSVYETMMGFRLAGRRPVDRYEAEEATRRPGRRRPRAPRRCKPADRAKHLSKPTRISPARPWKR